MKKSTCVVKLLMGIIFVWQVQNSYGWGPCPGFDVQVRGAMCTDNCNTCCRNAAAAALETGNNRHAYCVQCTEGYLLNDNRDCPVDPHWKKPVTCIDSGKPWPWDSDCGGNYPYAYRAVRNQKGQNQGLGVCCQKNDLELNYPLTIDERRWWVERRTPTGKYDNDN